jgi:hypothetical protein
MATFRKFAFPDGDTADKLLASLQPLDFAVPVGEIDKAVCVDILFNDTCPEPLAAFCRVARPRWRAFVQRMGRPIHRRLPRICNTITKVTFQPCAYFAAAKTTPTNQNSPL